MAKFRQVYNDFWSDPKVVEEMTPEDRYFFLYLLTNPCTTQIGIYKVTKKQMGFDLGYSTESINALVDRFENHHKLISYNAETREMALKNWGKYNLNKGGKPVIDCIKKELEEVKDISLIKYVSLNIKNEAIKEIYDTFYDTSTNRGTNRERYGDKNNNNNNNKNNNNNNNNKENEVVNDVDKNEELNYKDKIYKDFDKRMIDEGIKRSVNCKGTGNSYWKYVYKVCLGLKDIPQISTYGTTKFHNFEETFNKYSPEELERLIEASQKEKFKQ